MKVEQWMLWAVGLAVGWYMWEDWNEKRLSSDAVRQGDAWKDAPGMVVDGRGLTEVVRNAGVYQPVTKGWA